MPSHMILHDRHNDVGRGLALFSAHRCARRSVPILIVEDDPSTRAFLAGLLQSHGYPVMTATDGEQALADGQS